MKRIRIASSIAFLCCGLLTIVALAQVFAAEKIEKEFDNPYSVSDDMSTSDLVRHIKKMLRKPVSIRKRPGFSEALCEAADRVLENKSTTDQRTIAITGKLTILHEDSMVADTEADKQIAQMLVDFSKESDEKLSAELKFYHLEKRATEDEVAPEDSKLLLDDLEAYFIGRKPTNRDLRLASATVRLINNLPEDKAANKAYKTFGGLFAKSADLRMRKYGRKIAKGAKPATMVGKPIELAGLTLNGGELDWSSYRGKVVLIDFWATWCGPCRREMPHVIAAHKKYQSKGFDVIGISLDDDIDALKEYVDENKMGWTQIITEDGENPMATKYKVNAIPKTFLVDKKGIIIAEDLRGEAIEKKLAAIFAGE